MKKLFLFISVTCCAMYTYAQQMSKEEQQAMMAYAQPGPMHQMLAKSAGNWTEETTMWMAPGTPAMKNTATSTNVMIMDGRYQQSTHTGNFMGMPFTGVSTTGYDNTRKVFTNTWIDNMGTGIMYSEGVYNEKNKSIEFKGKCTDCTKGKSVDFRQIMYFIDDNHQKMEMYMPDKTGKEFKGMEILFTRQS